MSKAVLISIRPKWCDRIIRGKKTIEIRKTRPKLETPFKVYIYCTKAPQHLITIFKDGEETMGGEIHHGKPVFIKCDKYLPDSIRDKTTMVIGEFICDDIHRIGPENCIVKEDIESAIAGSCLTIQQVKDYAGWKSGMRYADLKDLYGWHISDLKIYDSALALSEFSPNCRYKDEIGECKYRQIACLYQQFDFNPDGEINVVSCDKHVEKAPQSWCYVEERGDYK